MITRRLMTLLLAALVGAPLGCGKQPSHSPSQPYVSPWAGYWSPQYAGTDNWLCHPERTDGPCNENLDSTIVNGDGSLELDPLSRAEDPEVDCFYVYPTCSLDAAPRSDLEAGIEETFVAKLQTARLVEHCRVFAPIYRQVTISGLLGGDRTDGLRLAYEDVVDAFKHYMANDNDGRGVILIGHSQGAMHLRRLVQEEFEESELLKSQLVSAYITGTTVEVPPGEVVGGSFNTIPLCTADTQIGCVVSYATFRTDEVFDERTTFGRAETEGMEAACTNPASLAGGRVPLGIQYPSEFPVEFELYITGNVSPFAEPSENEPIMTPFFSVPGLAEGECMKRDGISFLGVTVMADPEDARADDIGGDMILPGWGLHLVDVTVVMDDISILIRRQIDAFLQSDRS